MKAPSQHLYCARCRAELEVELPRVDYVNHLVIYAGLAVHATLNTLRVIETLALKYPKTVHRADIALALWGDTDGPENETGNVQVYTTYARRALAPLGWGIVSRVKHGIYLSKLPPGTKNPYAAKAKPWP